MDVEKLRSLSLNPKHKVLGQKIRHAETPDNPTLIRQFLDLRPHQTQKTAVVHRQHLVSQFYLLMETIADECLPPYWRRQCLDHIHQPLFALQRLAHCSQSKQQVQLLGHELRLISHYLQAGLSA